MISNSQYLLAGNPKSKLLQIRDWFFFQVAFREYNCSCLQEQKFWFCVLLLYTVLADLYLEWWWLHWNYCPFQHTVEFPFFFLSFGITFRSAAWQCVITILFRMPSENLVDLFTYKNYVVYLSLIYFGTSFTWWHQSQHYPAYSYYIPSWKVEQHILQLIFTQSHL